MIYAVSHPAKPKQGPIPGSKLPKTIDVMAAAERKRKLDREYTLEHTDE